jgi:hypothetical protein
MTIPPGRKRTGVNQRRRGSFTLLAAQQRHHDSGDYGGQRAGDDDQLDDMPIPWRIRMLRPPAGSWPIVAVGGPDRRRYAIEGHEAGYQLRVLGSQLVLDCVEDHVFVIRRLHFALPSRSPFVPPGDWHGSITIILARAPCAHPGD